MPIEALGSGSDYTPFLQHLGISSINVGYGGEDADAGIYHSTYDSFDHFIRFGDPKFLYGVALAETAGRLVLRAADADVLPMRFGDLADSVERYVSDVEKLADGERENSRKLRQLIDQGAFKLAADPETAYAPPPSPDDVPQFDFSALKKAAQRLKKSATNYDDAFEGALASDFRLPPAELAHLNGLLQGLEQTLTSPKGLPGREWYRHMLYAPGVYTGYAAKTLPAIRESIELRRWPAAIDSIDLVAQTLNSASARLDRRRRTLRQGSARECSGPQPTPPPPPDG